MRLLEDLVALAVLDLEGQVGAGDGLEVEGLQGQGPQVHELAGLVERLVADEQHARGRLDLHVAFQLLLAQVGFGDDLHLVGAGGQVGRLEADLGDAVGAGLALVEGDAPCRPCRSSWTVTEAPASGTVSAKDLTPWTSQRRAAGAPAKNSWPPLTGRSRGP